MFRVQKRLLLDFEDIYEPVFVENPFTQVTPKGRGLKQFHIGLTATKIIFGCDEFKDACLLDVENHKEDPEIETFQLITVLPLQFVRLKFYRKHARDIMEMRIVGGEEERPIYFEFGGHYYKNLFRNTWRDRIATIRLQHPLYFHISGASPFSTTDVILTDEEVEADIHLPPRPPSSMCTSLSLTSGY